MIKKGKSFWCEIWHQQIWEEVCIHRFKKGLKKCEGCQKGKELVAVVVAQLATKDITEKRNEQPNRSTLNEV